MAVRTFLTHLESTADGTRLDARPENGLHLGLPVRAAYDLDAIRKAVRRDELSLRRPDMWRYAELLPIAEHMVSLGEVMTPLLKCPRLAAALGLENLYVKDESRLPTGSFKARGMAMAITMARAFGISRVAVPSQGNAGGAAAAYAARAGLECFVFLPEGTPEVNRVEAAAHGAKVFLVDGALSDCGRIVGEGVRRMGWYDLSTMREPYRLEGKKTMGFELAEQLEWTLPDVILYPTGGGTGLIGMWKAFQELAILGWLESAVLPRMYACQSTGCAPIADAFARGDPNATPPPDPRTIATGLLVPKALGDFLVLSAVRASGGLALAADEEVLQRQMERVHRLEGIDLCPESAACVEVLERSVKEGHIRPDETVVLFNTAAAQKYVELLRRDLPHLSATATDWSRIR